MARPGGSARTRRAQPSQGDSPPFIPPRAQTRGLTGDGIRGAAACSGHGHRTTTSAVLQQGGWRCPAVSPQ